MKAFTVAGHEFHAYVTSLDVRLTWGTLQPNEHGEAPFVPNIGFEPAVPEDGDQRALAAIYAIATKQVGWKGAFDAQLPGLQDHVLRLVQREHVTTADVVGHFGLRV